MDGKLLRRNAYGLAWPGVRTINASIVDRECLSFFYPSFVFSLMSCHEIDTLSLIFYLVWIGI